MDLTNVCGPCTPEGKLDFFALVETYIQMPDEIDWLVV
jgi:hypothetical protein